MRELLINEAPLALSFRTIIINGDFSFAYYRCDIHEMYTVTCVWNIDQSVRPLVLFGFVLMIPTDKCIFMLRIRRINVFLCFELGGYHCTPGS